jgi:hypothetical protein
MTLTLDPAASRLVVETTAKGMLAKLAHDLTIAVSDWKCDASLEGGVATVTLRAPVASVRVEGVRKHGAVDKGVLSASDRSDIERKIREDVLVAREIVVNATAKDVPSEGTRSVEADVTIDAGRGKAHATARVTIEVTDAAFVAKGRVAASLSALHIPPVKGPLNAFRVDDKVDVVFEARFRRA